MPSGGISETGVNAVLAFIEGAEPKNEVEAALAIQMACAHAVTMAVLNRAGGAYGGNRHVATMAAAAARLLHAFTAQVETMRRLRSGGTQVIRIVAANLPADVLAKLRDLHARAMAISSDGAFFHFGGGLAVRNICRERLPDRELSACGE
jgi:hypothetical protein